jgi:voltage-gated potassium channel
MKADPVLDKHRYVLLKRITQLLEGPMVFLGFVWMVLLVVELIWGLSKALQYLSIAIWIVFIIDFLTRLFLAPQKLKYLKHNLLTLFSLIIPAIRVVRIFTVFRWIRGLRGLRMIKVLSSVNRSMRSLNATMKRRGIRYILLLTVLVILVGAAGMFTFEKDAAGGLDSYGKALWWTAMLIITIGSEYWPQTPEGRSLTFLLALYGFAMLGYITATIASFFVGRDAEEKKAPLASSDDIRQLKREIAQLTKAVQQLSMKQQNG